LLTVEDNGLGIDQAYVDQIFGMFFRATIQAKGTGLGLFITKAMVDKLDGKIRVKSQIKAGTTFFVELPMLMS
jgi:signal transduction histidine kinase